MLHLFDARIVKPCPLQKKKKKEMLSGDEI